jgi:hypothetical protein
MILNKYTLDGLCCYNESFILLSGYLVMHAAAGFIQLGCANDHHGIVITGWFAIDQSLGAGGFVAADHADGMQLVDALGVGHQRRHGTERLTAKVLIEAGNQDADPARGQLVGELDNFRIEELCLINCYDCCIAFDLRANIRGFFDGDGIVIRSGVRGDLFHCIADVDGWLKYLHLLLGNGGAYEAADQLVSLAAEHGAADDFNGTVCVTHVASGHCEWVWQEDCFAGLCLPRNDIM